MIKQIQVKDQKTNSSGASSMAQLMQKAAKTNLTTIHKGDIVKGIVTKLTPSEILIDINAKSEALVLERDKKIIRHLLSVLKVGDRVDVSVMFPESELGYPLVSLRKFIDEIAWKLLEEAQKQKKPVEVLITELTKGGFSVQVVASGVLGFIPHSHIVYANNNQDLVGKKINAYVLELSREGRKLILSQKAVLDSQEFDKIVKEIKIGQKLDSIISHITLFGMFVILQISKDVQVDGLVHISELSWERVSNIDQLFKVGQHIEAVVIGIDRNSKRVDLSIKRLSKDPFEEIAKNYAIDQKVSGEIVETQSFGALVDLDNGVVGFIRKEKIPPTVAYTKGTKIQANVSHIDKEKHRIILIPVLLEKPIGYR